MADTITPIRRGNANLHDAHAYLDELIAKGYDQVAILATGEDEGARVYHYDVYGEGHAADLAYVGQVMVADMIDAVRHGAPANDGR